MKTLAIYIYPESNQALGGLKCVREDMIERERGRGAFVEVFEVSGTPSELRDLAAHYRNRRGQFGLRVARTIDTELNALYGAGSW